MKTKKNATRMEGSGGSEFFICFTSRPSSSSATSCSAAMRVPSSKSLMSPGRNRDPAAPSLSRRLRSSGSVKGGQSPMFPAGVAVSGGGGRKKGCAFEAAEPSSPKVTCIGQVRVKTKKKKGQVVVRSRSQRGGGEASFRRPAEAGERECLPSRNQRWVHQLPISICEALRTFGSEFNCFLPCGGGGGRSTSSSSSSLRAGEEKRGSGGGGGEKRSSSSCGAVFARWLMAIQESEEGKRGEVVGLVVEERGKGEVGLLVREREEERDLVEFEVEEVGGNRGGVEKKVEEVVVVEREEEEEEGCVSVCIPPRNALLLMRCRSDPVRMAAIANRLWGSPAAKPHCQEEEEEDEEEEELVNEEREKAGQSQIEEKEELDSQAEEVSPDLQEVEKENGDHVSHPEGVVSTVALDEEKMNPTEDTEDAEEVEEQRQRLNEAEEEGAIEEEGTLSDGFAGESPSSIHKNLEEVGEEVENAILLEEHEELKEGIHSMEIGEEEVAKGRRSVHCSSSKSNEGRRSNNSSCLSREKEGGRKRNCSSKAKERRRHSFSTEKEARRHCFSWEREVRRASFSMDREGRRRWSFSLDKEHATKEKSVVGSREEKQKEETMLAEEEAREEEKTEVGPMTAEEIQAKAEEEVAEEGEEGEGEGEKRGELPDCLLMMMYEPKLSMEVSKETWVCSTNFLRWRPNQPSKAVAKVVEGGENRAVIAPTADSTLGPPPPPPPPPAPAPAAAPPTVSAIEQKLSSSAVGPFPPPFVLTRCKSEPVKSSARLAPDVCFWTSRHQPIGAAGIGF